jgi:predicted enzyme related to lactoylglutathione lyase
LAFAQTQITDRAGLEGISANLAGSYVLTDDIDLSDGNWTPLGNFTGTLDGNGHVIKNMTISLVQDGTAFFQRIQGSAVVKNLGFENASVTNLTQSRTAVVAGFLEGDAVIENCYIANSTITGRWCVGSFVGRARNITDGGTAAVRNCYSSATIFHSNENNDGRGMSGGIIGNIYDGNKMVVEKCYFSGIIQKVYSSTESAGTSGITGGEGNIAGIVGWIGQDNNQTLSGYTVQNNVNLAPYILSNQGKHRISSTRSDENVNNPTDPNYSLSTTVVDAYDKWGSSTVVPTDGTNYGAAKKDGANIPAGDANAKAQSFYETTLGWNFTPPSTGIDNSWKIVEGGSYPYFSWAKDVTSFVTVPASVLNALSVTESNPLDLSKYIFSGRGRALTFSAGSDSRFTLSDGVITIVPPVSVDDVIEITVQEAAFPQTRTLQVTLEATKSKNVNLAGIALSAGSLVPSFNPAVTSYTVLVPQGVTSITSTATVEDALSSVSGDGAIDVSAGATQTVTVTAEYGNTTDYVINYVIPNYITDRTGLAAVSGNGNYMLVNDIDLSDGNWTPLGDFTGIFDGNKHVIYNLTIDNLDAAAFFGKIKNNAVVRNLGFEEASVTDATHSRTAILAAFMEGNAVIENCYVANSTVKGRWCVGSFVGRATATTNAIIRNCYSSAYLYTPDYDGGAGHTGGIIGNIFANGVTVENCYFSGVIQRISGNNSEGEVAGIVGWNGTGGPNQTNVNSIIKNNVNLAPYFLSNYGKHRIAGSIQDLAGGDPTPGPNYSLSSTVVSVYNDWENISAIIPTSGSQYGAAKKDGVNISDGDANAKAQTFYETTLQWDFTNVWAINDGNSYPHFTWADQNHPYFVVPQPEISLTNTPIDLSKYIFSGRGLGLTFSTASDKITFTNSSTIKFAQPISTEETVIVKVQEGSLSNEDDLYELRIKLIPAIPFEIAANTEASVADYNPVSYTDIIFNEGSQLTGIASEGLEVNGVVKINKTFHAGQWYAVGFPFAIDNVSCDIDISATAYNKDLLKTNNPAGTGGDLGDYWLKTYDGNNFIDYAPASTTIAAGGYALQVPTVLDGAIFTFTSASGVTLSNASDFAGNQGEYTLVNNPSVANLTLTQGSTDSDNDYYRLGAASNFGLFSDTYDLKPFESVIVAKGIASNNLKTSLNIETVTGINDVPANDPVKELRYYNLQGMEIATPLHTGTGVYIVKTVYQSGAVSVSKIIRK